MEGIRWPAVALQGIFLAANLSFFLGGNHNIFILISFSILVLLFMIQTLSGNIRFIYLFPVDSIKHIPTVSWDTWILRGLIVTSVFFFYLGAAGKYLLGILILAVGLGFPIAWDRWLNEGNKKRIEDIKSKASSGQTN